MGNHLTMELIRQAQTGDSAASGQLLEENTGLIWSVVKRFLGYGVEADDLFQLGCIGFMKAVNGFDLEYGTQFSTYAVPKISGEIRRFLRDDGSVKVSRGIKEQAKKIRSARSALEQELGREPTVQELAAETGWLPAEIASVETATGPLESLQRELGEDNMTLEQFLSDDGQEERLIERLSLNEAVSSLAERERMVISLRYFHDLTQDKTARVLGVSQVQISRLERRAIAHLREMLIPAGQATTI